MPCPSLGYPSRDMALPLKRVADISRQGTTFSGVAYAFATNTEAKEDIIVEWPGAGTQTKQKVRPRRFNQTLVAKLR